ncbi:MAG: hypothetical protein PVI71_01350 [Desulfobacterales bacterium]
MKSNILLTVCIYFFLGFAVIGITLVEGAEPVPSPPDTPLASGKGGLYGRITYNDIPVHRARIIFSTDPKDLYQMKKPSTYTDKNGYYFQSNLSPGGYYLAAGWPDQKKYWFIRQQAQPFPKGVDVQVEAGRYTFVPSLPLYVVIDLVHPADGAITSERPKFRWTKNQYLQKYEFSLVRRDINADVLEGEIILKRRPVKGTEFQPNKPLKPGIYWWTVSSSSNGKSITAPKEDYYGGVPIRLPGERPVSGLGHGNDFAVPSPSGKVMTRETPSLILAAIPARWKNKSEKRGKLSDLYRQQTKSRRLHTLIATDNITKLGGSKQARKIGETLLKMYGEKHSVGLAPISQVSMAMMMGVSDCSLVWISGHPWKPAKGLKASDIKILYLAEKVIEEMASTFFYIKPAALPAGTYVNQPEDVRTIGIYR